MSDADSDLDGKRHWYNSDGSVVLLLFLCFPLGLFGMWKGKRFNPAARFIITGIFLLPITIGMIRGARSQKAPEETGAVTKETSVTHREAKPANNDDGSINQKQDPVSTQNASPDIKALQSKANDANNRYNAEYTKHSCFQANGKITSRTADTLIIWGRALPVEGTSPHSIGLLMDEKSFVVKNYDQNNIHADYYQAPVYFIESGEGKGAFGQTISCYIYSEIQPDQKRMEKLKNAADKAQADLDAAVSALKAEQDKKAADAQEEERARFAPLFQRLSSAPMSTEIWQSKMGKTSSGHIYYIEWTPKKKNSLPIDAIQVAIVKNRVSAFIQGHLIGNNDFVGTKITAEPEGFIPHAQNLLSGLYQLDDSKNNENANKIFGSLMDALKSAPQIPSPKKPFAIPLSPDISAACQLHMDFDNNRNMDERSYFYTVGFML